jgi:hypothetical protein
MIKYSQFFPEKYLEGDYEIVGRVIDYPLNNKGRFDISLCESCLWLSDGLGKVIVLSGGQCYQQVTSVGLIFF